MSAADLPQRFHHDLPFHVLRAMSVRRSRMRLPLFGQSGPDLCGLPARIARITPGENQTDRGPFQFGVRPAKGMDGRMALKDVRPKAVNVTFHLPSLRFLSNAFSRRCRSDSSVDTCSPFRSQTKYGTPNARLTRVSRLVME